MSMLPVLVLVLASTRTVLVQYLQSGAGGVPVYTGIYDTSTAVPVYIYNITYLSLVAMVANLRFECICAGVVHIPC
jgi:hypothetical protein